MYCISRYLYQCYSNNLFWGCLDSAVGRGGGYCSARRCCRGREVDAHRGEYIYIIISHRFSFIYILKVSLRLYIEYLKFWQEEVHCGKSKPPFVWSFSRIVIINL